jgi:hypothetical protein
MTFGLRNAAQTFQRFFDKFQRGLDCRYIYIYDIFCTLSSQKEHLNHLRELSYRLENYAVVVNTGKLVFS